MKCPKCGHERTVVYLTGEINEYRQCLKCGRAFADHRDQKIEELEVYEKAFQGSYITNCLIDGAGVAEGDYLFNASTGEYHLDNYAIVPRKKYEELEARLTLALDALRQIQEHEHCKVKLHRCSVPIEEWRELCAECEKEDSTMYVVGRIEGHRCCAAIAKAALEKIGEGKNGDK